MKQLFIYVFLLLTGTTFSQEMDLGYLTTIELEDSLDCKKAEPKALAAAEYVLSHPAKKDYNISCCSIFLIKWMEKTSDYTFTLGGGVGDAVLKDDDLFPVYLAAQVQTSIEDRIENGDDIDYQVKYTTLLLNYCENKENKVKINSKLKKFIEAKNNGTLKEMLAKK
jgi:hypothetical protein